MQSHYIKLVDALRLIDRDVKVTTEREFLPVGELMHEAARTIEEVEKANQEKAQKIAELEELLSEAFPIK
jgi:hypothetical protein